MLQSIPDMSDLHKHDAAGNPAGGRFVSLGVDIKWQDGPVNEAGGRNGAFVEDLLSAVVSRLQLYQRSRFACAENGEALAHIDAAIAALDRRTARRREAGIEGRNIPDREAPTPGAKGTPCATASC